MRCRRRRRHGCRRGPGRSLWHGHGRRPRRNWQRRRGCGHGPSWDLRCRHRCGHGPRRDLRCRRRRGPWGNLRRRRRHRHGPRRRLRRGCWRGLSCGRGCGLRRGNLRRRLFLRGLLLRRWLLRRRWRRWLLPRRRRLLRQRLLSLPCLGRARLRRLGLRLRRHRGGEQQARGRARAQSAYRSFEHHFPYPCRSGRRCHDTGVRSSRDALPMHRPGTSAGSVLASCCPDQLGKGWRGIRNRHVELPVYDTHAPLAIAPGCCGLLHAQRPSAGARLGKLG